MKRDPRRIWNPTRLEILKQNDNQAWLMCRNKFCHSFLHCRGLYEGFSLVTPVSAATFYRCSRVPNYLLFTLLSFVGLWGGLAMITVLNELARSSGTRHALGMARPEWIVNPRSAYCLKGPWGPDLRLVYCMTDFPRQPKANTLLDHHICLQTPYFLLLFFIFQLNKSH